MPAERVCQEDSAGELPAFLYGEGLLELPPSRATPAAPQWVVALPTALSRAVEKNGFAGKQWGEEEDPCPAGNQCRIRNGRRHSRPIAGNPRSCAAHLRRVLGVVE